MNRDGVPDIIGSNFSNGSAGTLWVQLGVGTTSPYLPRLSLYTASDARGSLSIVSSALDRVNSERASIGSQMSRLSVAQEQLATQAIEFDSAAPRIMDADVAEEASNMIRLQVLEQGAAAVLAHANLDQKIILKLLG